MKSWDQYTRTGKVVFLLTFAALIALVVVFIGGLT